MSSKTTASRRKKINLTRKLYAFLGDCLFVEKRSWDKIDARKYARMVTSLEEELKRVNPTFKVSTEGGVTL